MFPIESYHKFRYAIVFYDDYTSHAWTINLRTKDAALPATRHFLAMVETKYQKQVHGWMSDAGGEYTSKAFVEMMKEQRDSNQPERPACTPTEWSRGENNKNAHGEG
jgi:hypothetical protein